MTTNPKRTLVWPSSSRIPYTDVPEWVEARLRASFPPLEVLVTRDPEALSQALEECEILVSWSLQPEQFALCRKLQWIHSPAAGVTQLCVPELVESDVLLTNARTVHAIPVAEHAIALLLALARRLKDCSAYQAERRWGQADSWQPGHLPTELNGRTLGLVGLGAIGREIAVRAKALGMRVVAVKRNPTEGTACAERVESPDHLHALLAEADFVILAAPETPETRHLIGATQLRCLKPTAFLINVSRGSLVDTDGLVKALESGAIAGAALDVTSPEPLPPEHPLWRLPNVLLTPHLGGASDRYWQHQVDLLQENLRRYLSGQPLLNVVDKRRGY
ncbi:MAG: D-2-hydroxyacid dehydrogenase [Acidobacteria bacterium]|nr:D-2-hydroxyacid dehydrogenase [Acidobacteriota bacterium]